MNSKLTLKLNKKVIERAKTFAKKKNTSLSKLVEGFFENLPNYKKESMEITPLVLELSGIAKIPKDITSQDVKETYTDHLVNKYL